MKTNKKVAYIFIGLIVVINIIGFIILPDTLVMQVTAGGGAGLTLSKPIGILSMLAIGIMGALYTIFSQDESRVAKRYLILGIILVVYVIVFIFNM
ncbi:hypothetical protein RJI07_08780 [Mycoplasmatota bacterium WC30]